MKKISLFYWHRGCPNLGDEASPYIVEHLSTCKIKKQGLPIRTELKTLLNNVLHLRVSTNINNIIESVGNAKEYIVGLGSIIQYSSPDSYIWGSGFQNSKDTFLGGNVLAVRGPMTDDELVRRGYEKCGIYGDPGLLMPLIYQPQITPPISNLG